MYKIYKNGDNPAFALKAANGSLIDNVIIESGTGVTANLPKGISYVFYEDTGIVIVINGENTISGFSIPYTDVRDYLGNVVGDKTAVFNYLSLRGIHPADNIPVVLPTPGGGTLTAYYGYSDTDPSVDPTLVSLPDSLTYNQGATSIQITWPSNYDQKYLVFKVPSSQTAFITWYNSDLNKGQIPDQLYQAPLTIGGFTYYFTRTIATIDPQNTVFTYSS